MEDIIKEKTSADHLLYVSLKYTKTCDVILNLLARWKSLIEICFDKLLLKGVEKGTVPRVPISPKERIEFIKTYYKKVPEIIGVVPLYIFFKRVPDLDKFREGEFRKNVNLKIKEPNRTTDINMERLGEYSEVIDTYITTVRKLLRE